MSQLELFAAASERRSDDLSDLDFKRGGRRLEAERKRIARFEMRHRAPACRCARPLEMPESDGDVRCARCGHEVRP